MSAAPPPQQNDDDWQATEPDAGQWEDDEPRVARRPARRRPRTATRGGDRSVFERIWGDPSARPLVIVGGVALLGMCALACFALIVLALAGGVGDRVGGLFKAAEAEATSGPAVPITVTLQDKVQVNGTPVPPGIPTRLSLGSRTFEVRPLVVDNDRAWRYDVNNKRAAYWAAGTLINYVIGLHNSTDNRELFDAVVPGDLLSLETGVGVQRYRVLDKIRVPAADMTVLNDQSSPRLTLVMLGQSGEERDALVAQYTDEGTPNEQVALGAPVNLGDARVVAYETRLVPGGSAGLTEGKNYYQVNIRVTNVVTRILDTAQFYAELVDGQGNRYQLAQPGATAAGGLGWAQGALQPGASVTATAAFEVPNSMAGPFLEWRFSLDGQNPYVARVAIPYMPIFVEPTPVATRQPRVRVDIANANISPDGTEISVIGNLTNLTDQALTVSLQNAALAGPDGARAPLNSSLPPLPWEVNPNATLTFKLTFAMPVQFPATFTLLEQSVTISPN